MDGGQKKVRMLHFEYKFIKICVYREVNAPKKKLNTKKKQRNQRVLLRKPLLLLSSKVWLKSRRLKMERLIKKPLCVPTSRLVSVRKAKSVNLATIYLSKIIVQCRLIFILTQEQNLVAFQTLSLLVATSWRLLKRTSMVSTGTAQTEATIVNIVTCYQWATF